MRKFVLFAATAGGSGYVPGAPGTAGSAVGLLLYLPLAALPPAGYLLAVAGVAGLGVWAADRAGPLFGSKDDRRITVDEVAGMLLALALLPPRIDVAAAAFLLFRLLDVTKPPPARAAESLPGGVGVVADDLVAGLYANLIGQLLWRGLWPQGLA
jgi:phosphatidylglycerophosphatase A